MRYSPWLPQLERYRGRFSSRQHPYWLRYLHTSQREVWPSITRMLDLSMVWVRILRKAPKSPFARRKSSKQPLENGRHVNAQRLRRQKTTAEKLGGSRWPTDAYRSQLRPPYIPSTK